MFTLFYFMLRKDPICTALAAYNIIYSAYLVCLMNID